jgi:peptidoglycan/LPS O-acetylase OafA/YrhL
MLSGSDPFAAPLLVPQHALAPSRTKPYYPALTGVRAVAAYLVYFYHFNPFPPQATTRLQGLLWALVDKFNNLGVCIFFVLSGFLIAVRYHDTSNLSGPWLTRYFWHRIARLYPLYLLLTCLTFLVFCLRPDYDIYGVWANYSKAYKLLVPLLNLTLLRGFFEQFLYSGLLQGWSLTVEACFYLVAPVLLLAVRRRPAALLLGPLLLLGIGCLLVAWFSHHPTRGGFFVSYDFMLGSTFLGRSSEFSLGIALAQLVRRRPACWPAGSGLTGGFLLLLALLTLKMLVPFDNWALANANVPALLVNHVLLPGSIAWLFYGLVTHRSWLRQLLETKVCQILGSSSYAFYLLHIGVIQLWLHRHVAASALVLFPLLIGLSILLYKYVEVPLQRLLLKQRG